MNAAYTLEILKILMDETDETHPMKLEDIAEKLREKYGSNTERKAVGRCIEDLGGGLESGGWPYRIEHAPNKGYYISERPFENAELRVLIDGVLSSRYLNSTVSQNLINKLIAQGDRNFHPNVSSVTTILDDWSKTSTIELFDNVETIESAMKKNVQISFNYSHFDVSGELVVSRLHDNVSPYRLFVKNQRYYVMVYEDGANEPGYLRVDKIKDIKELDAAAKDIRNIPGYKRDYNLETIITTLPYMFSGPTEHIRMRAKEEAIDAIWDYFGKNATIGKQPDGTYMVSINTGARAMEYWALQYVGLVEIVEPKSLRDKIRDDLSCGLDKYSEDKKS
ncbi:MAG: WYL domain-containing protein [Clostridia bacterium]|nr:WYL domain-containing protein [Clostridia bacterium]